MGFEHRLFISKVKLAAIIRHFSEAAMSEGCADRTPSLHTVLRHSLHK
jgi:hypothetical protein